MTAARMDHDTIGMRMTSARVNHETRTTLCSERNTSDWCTDGS